VNCPFFQNVIPLVFHHVSVIFQDAKMLVPDRITSIGMGIFISITVTVFMVVLVVRSNMPVLSIDRSLGLRKIKPGYYVYLHGDAAPGVSSTFNSGIIITDEVVVVIDALGSEAIAHTVREAILAVTAKPVRFLISCTFHTPFSGGNSVYADTLKIGHEYYKTDLSKLLQDASAEEKRGKLPDQTYSERMTLYLGGKEIQIIHLGKGHTRGDTIVFVPEDRIVYLSEVFNFDEFPYIADGYSADWMQTLETVESLEADIFVPGHGFLPVDPKETRAGIRRHWQILKDVRDAVQQQLDRGMSEDEALRAIDLPQYRKFKGYQRALEIAVRRIYKELTGGLL
jgi:glyoxylase-like metal-dependent hydrolase (beta-lactamase superfamily II)